MEDDQELSLFSTVSKISNVSGFTSCCSNNTVPPYFFSIKDLPQLHFIPNKLTTKDLESVKFLANGSKSTIFTAYRRNEKVAVKIMSENSALAAQEIVLEAGMLARLKHPNIIKIFGAGEQVRKLIVLENLEGGTLSDILRGRRNLIEESSLQYTYAEMGPLRLPIHTILNIAYSLISAIKYLHFDVHPDAIIIHRGN